MATARLSPTQLDFLRHLFGKANGNLALAAKEAIGTEDYSQLLTDELLDAIKKRADDELVLNIPKAVFIMSKMLSEPEGMLYSDKLHKVAADVLDRAGLSKRERPSSGNVTVGIVLLPNKQMLPEPPNHEIIDQQASPTAIPA